jgi:fumarylacetoacetase
MARQPNRAPQKREKAMTVIDETHDPRLRSWIASANGHAEFPIQNLPLGVFSPRSGAPRGGVAIGDSILDLNAALAAGFFSGEAETAARAAAGATLNAWMGLDPGLRAALRKRLSAMLAEGGADAARASALSGLLHASADCRMHLPAAIGDYTDFYAGIHHATNGGRRNRPGQPPLNPNYKYVPVAYHSRASTVRPSGETIRRPRGQYLPAGKEAPEFGPCQKLDFELEFGAWIGPGNAMGEPIPIDRAANHIAGYCLLNDWSARDVQRWESQPLGPFLAKNFGTSISPWVVTVEALAPFRIAQPPRPEGDPRPLPYLWDDADQRQGALNIELEALLLTEGLRAAKLPAHRLALSNTAHLYWTYAQMVAHHACGGCQLNPGDLFGSGTISAPTREGYGSMGEITETGTQPIALASGEKRGYLEDGDEVILRAHARRDGFVSIGFGENRGRITPSP